MKVEQLLFRKSNFMEIIIEVELSTQLNNLMNKTETH